MTYRTLVSFSLATLTLVLVPQRTQAAGNCTPSRTMIILDKSSSMITGIIDGTPKWNIAVTALDAVASTYEASIELGLMMFPSPNQCSPGAVFVEPGMNKRAEITAALGDPPPSSGNYTPMAETLDAARAVPSLAAGDTRRFVILVTDGWQWCHPPDPDRRFAPVDSVKALESLGVTTYVVGFGAEVDALTLNRMAVEGGTAPAGCDPTGDSPGAANPCYYRAEDSASLIAGLTSIAIQISAETCDGADNDCDGAADEDLVRECSNSCGGVGQEACVSAVWTACDAPVCNCATGETRPCGLNIGACERGSQTCGGGGLWGVCAGGVEPAPEACDGIDNDCDNAIDEDGAVLCPQGQLCRDGVCGDVPEPGKPAVDMIGGDSGCRCEVGRGSGFPVIAWLAFVAVVPLLRLRRRNSARRASAGGRREVTGSARRLRLPQPSPPRRRRR